MIYETASQRTKYGCPSPRKQSGCPPPRIKSGCASPRAVWNLVAAPPTKKIPKLKSIPNVILRKPLPEGKWHECGCSRSMAKRAQKVDLTPRQHAHLMTRDEAPLHYIFDRQAYLKINQLACQEPHLKQWILDRCKEGRLFVAKPPPLPPSTEPWGYDSPPKLGILEPGWRAWEPRDMALTFSAWNSVQEYHDHLETFFLWLNITGVMKSNMMETAEAWMLACGDETNHLKVKNRRTCKLDRCFVTADMEIFELVLAKWDSVSCFPRSLKGGEKMKYMRRLMDIRLDPHRSSDTSRVDPCKMGHVVHNHQICSKHGQYKLRRPNPPPVSSFRTPSPRKSPRARVLRLDELACSGSRWNPWPEEDWPFIKEDWPVGLHVSGYIPHSETFVGHALVRTLQAPS